MEHAGPVEQVGGLETGRSGTRRYLVISDAHFGTPESSINHSRFAKPLVAYICAEGPWEEIIFTGDLLDVNLATFTRSIEGGKYPDIDVELFGFRQFIGALDAELRRTKGHGLTSLAQRWVYIPGNHDYKVWDMLATKIVCEDVLAAGNPMGTVKSPLKQYRWDGDRSFFAGIYKPFNAAGQVTVIYPNYELPSGSTSPIVVFTHGHYLDPSQTWGHSLHEELSGAADAQAEAKAVRAIVIDCAQYQTLANAVSFTKRTRKIINALFGPAGLKEWVKAVITQAAAWILRLVFLSQSTRGKRISETQLRNIEQYLARFTPYAHPPKCFMFGHTHRQDSAMMPAVGTAVFNAGSFYPDHGMPITFAEIHISGESDPRVSLMCVDAGGQVRETRPAQRGA